PRPAPPPVPQDPGAAPGRPRDRIPEADRSAHGPCRIAPLQLEVPRTLPGGRGGRLPKKRPASSTGSPTVSKQSGARQGLAEAVDQAVELGVGVELDLDRAPPRVPRDPHARAETPRGGSIEIEFCSHAELEDWKSTSL